MEESKFLEAKNLKNQISYLEECIENMNRFGAEICVSWKESVQMINCRTPNASSTPGKVTQVRALPKDIENKVIELMKDKLEELKQQFIEL